MRLFKNDALSNVLGDVLLHSPETPERLLRPYLMVEEGLQLRHAPAQLIKLLPSLVQDLSAPLHRPSPARPDARPVAVDRVMATKFNNV